MGLARFGVLKQTKAAINKRNNIIFEKIFILLPLLFFFLGFELFLGLLVFLPFFAAAISFLFWLQV